MKLAVSNVEEKLLKLVIIVNIVTFFIFIIVNNIKHLFLNN